MKRLALIVALLAAPVSGAMAQGVPSPINSPSPVTVNHCAKWAGNNQLVDAGDICGGGSMNVVQQGTSNLAISSTTNAVELNAAFPSPLTDTLPCSSAVPAGRGIQIYDRGANLSVLNSLKITTDSVNCPSDTLNGAATNTSSLWSPGAAAYAISNGIGNWSVHVAIPPTFSLDFVASFGGVPAKVPGTGSCVLGSGSNGIACSGTIFSAADVGDVVTAEACGPGGAMLVTTLSAVSAGTGNATLANTPSVATCSSAKMIFEISAATGGLGYKFGGTETFVGGSGATVTQTGTPALMGIGAAAVNAGGSGGTNGACTVTLAPANGTSTALQGVQATISGTVTSHALAGSLTITTSGSYTAFNTYTYDGSGNYDNVPVTGCGLSGATVNIGFSIQAESLGNKGIYATAPCNNTNLAASSTSSSNATVAATFNCRTASPIQWIGADNKVAQQKAFAAQNAANLAGAPVTVTVNNVFMTSGSNPSLSVPAGRAAAVTGQASWAGIGPVISGFYHIPNSGCLIANYATTACNDVFPIVDSTPGAGIGNFGFQATANGAGSFFRDMSFWGDTTSTTIDNAITGYGPTKWVTVQNIFAANMTGHMFGIGADASGCGVLEESNFDNLRTYRMGNAVDRVSSIAFDSVCNLNQVAFTAYISGTTMTVTATGGTIKTGYTVTGANVILGTTIVAQLSGATGGTGTYQVDQSQTVSSNPGESMTGGPNGPGSNNMNLIRLRSFDDAYYSVTILPCNGTGNGSNGAHVFTMTDMKIEKSGLDDAKQTVGSILMNSNSCTTTNFPSSTGTPITGANENNVTEVWITATDFTNPSVNSYAIEMQGLLKGDISQIFIQADFTSAHGSHGGGVLINACQLSCIIDSMQDTTSDYGLSVISSPNAGQIGAGVIEYNGHTSPLVFQTDPGLSVSCEGGLGAISAITGLCQSTTVNPHPGYRNHWYLPFPYNSAQTATGVAYGSGVVVCEPGTIEYPVTLSALGARVATASGGGNIQLAVYSNGSWSNPANLLAATGSISTTSTGEMNSAVSVSLSQGEYWFCMNTDNGTAAVNAYTEYLGPSLLGAGAQANVISDTGTISAVSLSQTFGTWPNWVTGTSWTAVTSNPPVIGFNVASSP